MSRFVICSACGCHLRAGDRECPQCAATLGARGSTRAPRRRGLEVRRVLLATMFAGVSGTACAGLIVNDDVAGDCASKSGATCDYQGYAQDKGCYCGTGGRCVSGQCVSCDCTIDQHCDDQGACQAGNPHAQYWFGGRLPGNPPTASGCYGSPPAGARARARARARRRHCA